jgi:F-type H+-transporting ATPase subunit delta
LAEVAFEKGVEDKAVEGLGTFAEIFRAIPDTREIFDSPAAPRETKEKLLDELLAHYPVEPIVANFLCVLLKHNRLRYLQNIMEAFVPLMNEHKGVVAAKVVTAAPLEQGELGKISERLGKITGKRVTVEAETDEDLLGGMVVNIGSTIYDGSVRTQLAEMKRRLLGLAGA